MAIQSSIEWTDASWNPWQGCHKVSAGCRDCYAEKALHRWGKRFDKPFRSTDKTFNLPLTWKKPLKVFPCSLSDFFLPEADQWRSQAWQIIKQTPHTYIILTKRAERINNCLPDDWNEGYDNVLLGTSGETAATIVDRSKIMKDVKAKIKFISIEPLLQSVSGYTQVQKALEVYNWVIVGGESGKRKCEAEWITGVVNICRQKNIPVFVKQMGSKYSKKHNMSDWKGGNIDQFPENLQVRQWPTVREEEKVSDILSL